MGTDTTCTLMMGWPRMLIALVTLALQVSTVNCQRKILALHGGGMNGAAFRAMMGDYISTLGGSYEFVFPDAPNPAGNGNFNWVIDPPGGKSAATTDPNIAASSTALLNGILRSQGPFYGIFGYSQGAMFTGYYLTQVPANTFQVAVMACGYVPATHQGLVQTINAAAPISGARRALVFIGEQDRTISPAMSTEQSTKFSPQTVTVVRSPTAGHQPPNPSDSAFSTVITFLRGSGAGPPARRPDIPPAHRPDSPPARRPDSPPARPPAGQTPPGKSSSGGKGSTKKGTNSKKAQEGTKNANRWGSWGSEEEDLLLNTLRLSTAANIEQHHDRFLVRLAGAAHAQSALKGLPSF